MNRMILVSILPVWTACTGINSISAGLDLYTMRICLIDMFIGEQITLRTRPVYAHTDRLVPARGSRISTFLAVCLWLTVGT